MSRPDRSSQEDRFEELYRSTAKDLLAFLTRRTSDPEEATDVLAEIYVVAWRRLEKIPPGDAARLWLFGVARNLLMKNAQRRQSHQALVSDLTQELARLAAYRPETTDPWLTEKMHAGLEKLPAKQREVLLLTAWEGLTPREIAKVTGATANVVRVRLHHAREQLARELRAPETGTSDKDELSSERPPNVPTMR